MIQHVNIFEYEKLPYFRSNSLKSTSCKKQDYQCTGFDQCIDSAIKCRTNDTILLNGAFTGSRSDDTVVLTSVSIVLQKVGLIIYWCRIVYQQSYKKQDLIYTCLYWCIDIPTKSRTNDTLFLTTVLTVVLLSRTNGLQD